MQSAIEILGSYWGYETFRGRQEEIIRAVLSGTDALALLPTGGGKSVCFQVPALMRPGMCIVVTPLIALMKDQVAQLEDKGIPAFAIHSGLSVEEVLEALENAVNNSYKFLYISPERIETERFQQVLGELEVNLIAVDEAHCISQWGYDFRPVYLRIAQLRRFFPAVPVLALTASATPPVQQDIIEKLAFKNYAVFRQSFRRDNLCYEVTDCDNKVHELFTLLHDTAGSSIVYCKSRRLTQEITTLLRIKNIDADFYHAGLSQEERNKRQQDWTQNKIRVMVCTNAFGMGIDKPDVRLVAHYGPPDCLENYYQEAGRAGRDGLPAKAVLLYHAPDITALQQLPDIRFPTFAVIKETYQHIADFLQIPVGIGKDRFYDFDLNTFIKNFKLDALQTIYAIKALEQAGFITFNESIFLPSKVIFTIEKERLYSFESSYPDLEPMVKCLLRSYEGIFSHLVSVFEHQLSRLLHIAAEEVVQQLQTLQRHGIIKYLPQKETPQISLLTNRASTEFMLFDHTHYRTRKKAFSDRVQKMLGYLQTQDCRSRYIAQYFGEDIEDNCGVCDNCKQTRESVATMDDFKTIHKTIIQLLSQQPHSAEAILAAFTTVSPEKVWQVLNFLQDEDRVMVDASGKIALH